MSVAETVTRNQATSQQRCLQVANQQTNPLAEFPEFLCFKSSHPDGTVLQLKLQCKRKADMDPKLLKWAFKLAERNVGPQYRACSLGWQPKIKQADLNKPWARYLVATDQTTKKPAAYTMFRFDLDYGRSVLYCYELQVEAEFQRKGLGAFMMKALEQMAKHFSMERVVLTVLKNNEDGMRFYRRLGYEVDDMSPDKEEKAAYEIMSKAMF
ncbi:N-alpha-acetyltransferase 40 [Anopheles maculipalpis]|uniref:N-alpha-acetyltransferase 40 n=1 Tax=Anopheles maculipalpis TaxID=1496333 RepID=UPI0021596702|nr:N-alpha-acetyltransferase 40 [Anopheles maculipalpis]